MAQRTVNSPIHLTLVPTLCVLLTLSATQILADTIAYTSFEGLSVFPDIPYIDTITPYTDHILLDNADEPLVNLSRTDSGSTLSFSSFFSHARNNEGLTDGDMVGVTNSIAEVGYYPDGDQGFRMSDTDGLMTTTMDSVGLDAFSNPTVSLYLYIAETGWEANDRVRVWTTVDGGTELDLFTTAGQDIDDLNIEGHWINLSASLTGYTTATLAFELYSNAEGEDIYVDNIAFTGEVVPSPGAFVLGSLGMGVASAWLRRKKI